MLKAKRHTEVLTMLKLKVKRHTEVCYCGVYKFPHRAGGGKCQGPGELLCSSCGEVATGHFTDFGIGAYEYWGAKCVDRNVQWVSTCCDATLLDNTAAKPEATPPESDYDERDYDD